MNASIEHVLLRTFELNIELSFSKKNTHLVVH